MKVNVNSLPLGPMIEAMVDAGALMTSVTWGAAESNQTALGLVEVLLGISLDMEGSLVSSFDWRSLRP